jgi:F0F1-type ATP synthase membrane subunit c/vacuolar-type H+-ATPase subunit K
MNRRRPDRYDDDYDYEPRNLPPEPTGKKSIGKSIFNWAKIAIGAAILLVGIGIGVAFSSTATLDPQNVASRDFIDRAAPNPELCVQYGASAMVMDARLYVTLSPFKVYVSQPRMTPGCIVRSNNWSLLEQRKLINGDQVRECKQKMNTFGFTGSLESKPEINCVYQNDAAQNLFLNQPGGTAAPTTGSDQF